MRVLSWCAGAIAVLVGLAAPPGASASTGDEAFRREARRAMALLAETFGRAQLLPIAMPEAQAPGDAYVFTSYWVPESRAATCFGPLPVETHDWPAVSSLRVEEQSAEGRFSLLRVLNLDARAQDTVSVAVTYLEPRSRTVPRAAMLAALKRPDCAHLEDALAARRVPIGSWAEARRELAQPTIVLLRVVEARRRIVLTLQAQGSAGLAVQNPQEVLRALGLGADPRARLVDGELAARLTGSGSRAVVIEDAAPVPVAFTPVALPRVRVDTALSAGGVAEEIVWHAPDTPDFGAAFTEALAAWQRRLSE